MKNSLFNYHDYKDFLKMKINSPEGARGYIRKLAAAASCQTSYLSTVLHSYHHLTPDHACGLCQFWNFTESETDYFLLLVDYSRCGTVILRDRLKRKIKSIQTERENLSKRLDRQSLPAAIDEAVYYSSWVWSALHILTSINEYQSVESIANRLQLPPEYVLTCLTKLEKLELVKNVKQKWIHSSASIHIPRESPLVAIHHNNWRQKAVLHSQMFHVDLPQNQIFTISQTINFELALKRF
jgi:uncharacterized protein (TIGR02147 family)